MDKLHHASTKRSVLKKSQSPIWSVMNCIIPHNNRFPSKMLLCMYLNYKFVSPFQIGDIVDAKDGIYGAWFPGQIVDIIQVTSSDKAKASATENDEGKPKNEVQGEDDLEFMIAFTW